MTGLRLVVTSPLSPYEILECIFSILNRVVPIDYFSATPKPITTTGKKKFSSSDYKRLNKSLDIVRESIRTSREAFAQYCKDSLELGFTGREALQYALKYLKNGKYLKDGAPQSTLYRWADEYLPSDAKKVTKPRNTSMNIILAIIPSFSQSPPSSSGFPLCQ